MGCGQELQDVKSSRGPTSNQKILDETRITASRHRLFSCLKKEVSGKLQVAFLYCAAR